jgi:hypothetical protein
LYEDCPECGTPKARVTRRCVVCEPPVVVPELPAPTDAPRGKAVLCQRCDRLSPAGSETCERCGDALYVECADCGERRPKVIKTCPNCETARRRRNLTPAPAMALPAGRGVLCSECDHLNPSGIAECEVCHRALFSVCRNCGKSRPRNQRNCPSCQPPELPRIVDLAPVGKAGRGVLCAQCEHLNPQGLEKCETCNSPLFVVCKKCSTPRPQVLEQCPVCHPLAAPPVPVLIEARPSGRGVLCAKCDHLNPRGLEVCETCNSALFETCKRCGKSKARNSSRCLSCASLAALRPPDPQPQSKPQPLTAEELRPAGRGILCAHCEHLNPLGLRECETCQEALFDICPNCDREKPAVRVECTACEAKERARALAQLESGPKGRAVLCAGCDHLNPTGLDACETCGRALFVECPECHTTRPAVVTECAGCRGTAPEHRDLLDNSREKGRGVLCQKCEHLNPADLEFCETCDADLYVECRRCHHRNLRVLARCERCRRRLQRSVGERLKSGPDRAPANVVAIIVGAVVVLLVAGGALWWAGFRLPRLW